MYIGPVEIALAGVAARGVDWANCKVLAEQRRPVIGTGHDGRGWWWVAHRWKRGASDARHTQDVQRRHWGVRVHYRIRACLRPMIERGDRIRRIPGKTRVIMGGVHNWWNN